MPTVNRQQAIQTVTPLSPVNIRYNLSEVIDMMSPTDVPFLQRIGQASLGFPCDQVKHEWMEDQLTPSIWALAAAYTAGTGQMTLASGQGKYAYIDDIIFVGDNVLRILAITGDVLNVAGGVGDSTDANAANAAEVRRLSMAAPEGGVARMDSRKTTIVGAYNYTQIIKDWTILTGTMEVIQRYGYVSERAYQEEKVMLRLGISLEQTLLYGIRSYSAGPPRRSTMGGLNQYILTAGINGSWGTVYDANGAQLTEILLNNQFQAIWEEGGMPSLILVNAFQKRIISGWSSPRVRITQPESTGGGVIGYYESEFGVFELMMDRWVRSTDLIILTPDEVGIGPLNGRAFGSKLLPSLGDYTQSEVLGEYTMEVRKGSMAHGWIYDLATS